VRGLLSTTATGNRVSETIGTTTTKYLVDTLNPTGYAEVMDELVAGAATRTYTYGLQPASARIEPSITLRQRASTATTGTAT
jgi:hypothetical protein